MIRSVIGLGEGDILIPTIEEMKLEGLDILADAAKLFERVNVGLPADGTSGLRCSGRMGQSTWLAVSVWGAWGGYAARFGLRFTCLCMMQGLYGAGLVEQAVALVLVDGLAAERRSVAAGDGGLVWRSALKASLHLR